MDSKVRQPLSFAGLLRSTWTVFQSDFRLFLQVIAIWLLSMVLAGLFTYLTVYPYLSPDPVSGQRMDMRSIWATMSWLRKGAIVIAYLFTFAVLFRARAATIFATSAIAQHHSIGVWKSYRCVRRKHLRLFWLLFILSSILAPTGLLALLVIALEVYIAPALPVAALEDRRAFEALRRSRGLTKGGYGRILSLLLIYLALATVTVVGELFLMLLVGKLPGGFVLGRLSIFLWLLALGFMQQLYFIALTLNYHDQRMHKENWVPTLGGTSANLEQSGRH